MTLKISDTGALRIAATDAQGDYRAPNPSLGAYEVQAALEGFRTEVRRGLVTQQAMPLNGRDFVQLAMLEPGVLRVTNTENTVAKAFGTRAFEVRAEAFNLLDRANFARPASTVFDANGRVGSAGRITSTSTAARQVQLGLRFVF